MTRMSKKLTRKEVRRMGWLAVIGLAVLAWDSPNPRLWGFPMFSWGAYELFFCPTSCGVQTKRDGSPCSNPVLGRLKACTRVGDHPSKKRKILLRMIGIGRFYGRLHSNTKIDSPRQATFTRRSSPEPEIK